MNEFSDYISSYAVDWRKQLQSNEYRTKAVIFAFIFIYLIVGLVIDLYVHPQLDQATFEQAIEALITFKVTPIATLILGTIAIISIFITYKLYDKIILLGTKYREISANKNLSLVEQQVYNIVEELKIAASLHYMPKIYVIEADYMNAFASGYSEKSALIAVTCGLLNKLNRDELQAVLAHELSHIRHNDIKLTLMATVLSNIMLIALDIIFNTILLGGSRKRSDDDNKNGGIVLVIIILRFLLPIVTVLLLLYLSRKREFMADAGSVELTRNNTSLAKALIKISDDHHINNKQYAAAYNNTSHEEVRREAYIFDPKQMGITLMQSISGVFSTHPSLEERLKALGFSKHK